jgi:hypothetical protein
VPSDAVPSDAVPSDAVPTALMWEARVAPGRIEELLAFVVANADSMAQIYRADGPDPRVVVIDPTGRGLADVPAELVARPPHTWSFTPVPR